MGLQIFDLVPIGPDGQPVAADEKWRKIFVADGSRMLVDCRNLKQNK